MSNQNLDESSINPAAYQARLDAEAEFKSLSTPEVKADEVKSEVPVSNVETTEAPEATEERQFTEIEVEQMDKGWDPNHPDGVSAKEFKRVGEIIEAKRKASRTAQVKTKEVEELTKTVKQLIEDQRKIKISAVEQARRELEIAKIEKIEMGDVPGFKTIEAKEAALRAEEEFYKAEQQAATAPTPIEDSEEIKKFKDECSFFLNGKTDADLAMQAYVRARAEDFMKNNPNVNELEAISSIRKGLQEVFPYRYENPNKAKPAMTMTSTASKTSTSPSSISSLDHEQRKQFELIRQADPSYSVKEYIDSLVLAGRISK